MGSCYHCGHVFAADAAIYRSTECPGCGRAVKVCLNCRFYDSGAPHACRETQAEWVKEKDRANFCGYFSLAERKEEGASSGSDKARDRFESLFGD